MAIYTNNNNAQIQINSIQQRLTDIQDEIDLLQNGVVFCGEFADEDERDVEITEPKTGNWVIITSSTNDLYIGQRIQYIYNGTDWIYAGGATSVNSATSEVKGILRLNGDLLNVFGSAQFPQLASVLANAGTYNFYGNSVTIDNKGRIINIIPVTSSVEWTYISLEHDSSRTINTDTFTVPTYDIDTSFLMFYFNGGLIPETQCWERIDTTTIKTKFLIRPEESVIIINMKFTGQLDHSIIINDSAISAISTYSSNKLINDFVNKNNDIIPKTDNTYDIGSTNYKYDNIYLQNAPTVLSSKKFKENIQLCDLGLNFIQQLNPVSFNYIGHKRNHYSFIAEEIETLLNGKDFGGFVFDTKTNIKALRLEQFIPILVKAIQEQQEQINYLKLPICKKIWLWIKNKLNKGKG